MYNGCVMCAVAAGERDAAKIGETPHAIAVLERFPCRRGHTIVVLRRHEERLERLDGSVWLELQGLAHRVARAIDRELRPVRTFVCALGSAAARVNSFPHVHLHVIPLYDGGEADRPAEVLTWSSGVFVYDAEEEAALVRALKLHPDRATQGG